MTADFYHNVIPFPVFPRAARADIYRPAPVAWTGKNDGRNDAGRASAANTEEAPMPHRIGDRVFLRRPPCAACPSGLVPVVITDIEVLGPYAEMRVFGARGNDGTCYMVSEGAIVRDCRPGREEEAL